MKQMKSNELKLNKKIYDLSDVDCSVRSYKNIANITVHQDECYIICKFTNCVYELTQTINEFENYLIQLSNSIEVH